MSWRTFLLVIIWGLAPFHARAADEVPGDFGFAGPEIFPLDPQISQLRVADLDGDGLKDLLVVNNARSKINLLYNQTGKTNRLVALRPTGRREFNELPPDARFRVDSIASESRIACLLAEDLNSDGRPDLVYYGDPRELVLIYNLGTNGWSAPKRWTLDDGQPTANGLCIGDINGDGRADLLLLADSWVYLLKQNEDKTLDEPVRIPFSGGARSVQVIDVNGDGLNDLLLVNWEDRSPFRFRLQQKAGQLGAEIYFQFPPIRSYWADSLEKTNSTQIMTIAQNSGRAMVSEFRQREAEKLTPCVRAGQFQVLPLSRTDKSRRGLLWADVNNDRLPDLLCAEPETGQISIFPGLSDGSLGAAKTYPSLAGVTDLAIADWEGKGRPEIFMLSADERQVGVTRLEEDGKLPFPKQVQMEGRPLALTTGVVDPGGKPALVVIFEQESGEEENRRSLLIRHADGSTRTQMLNKDFKARPSAVAIHDVDQDGYPDVVILSPYEKVKVLRQNPGKDFQEIDVSPPGGSLEQPWLSAADVDGDGKPELLLTQRNYLRAVVLKPSAQPEAKSTNQPPWDFAVKDQINGSASSSRLVAAAAMPNCTNGSPDLFLLDAEKKVISLCQRDESGVWKIVRNVNLPVSEFGGLQLLNPEKPSLALLGSSMVGYLPLYGKTWELTELDSYETPIKDGHLNDLVSGDLDNDGRKDLVFLETARNYVDLVLFDKTHHLTPGNRWQVFEERTFRSRRSDFPEPREAAVADVTGDGKNDLILLVHDRLLVYPQE